MATLTFDRGTGPGAAATRPVYAAAGRSLKFVTGTFDFDTSYPTGGESISDIADEFREFLGVIFTPKLGYVFGVDYTADAEKLIAYYADNDAGADSALIQVPDTTNLSTVTGVRFLAWGYA